MSKKEIRETLKRYNFRMIDETYHKSEKGNVIVCAVSDIGVICEFFVSPRLKVANWQMLSSLNIHDRVDCKQMFFGI